MNLHVGVLHYTPSCEPFPLLADPVHYEPNTLDMGADNAFPVDQYRHDNIARPVRDRECVIGVLHDAKVQLATLTLAWRAVSLLALLTA